MTRLYKTVLILFTAALTVPTATAQPQPPAAAKRPPTVPPGPFASWSADQQAATIKRVRIICWLLTVDGFGNYRGSQEGTKEDGMAFTSRCVASAMPHDWPGRQAELDRADELYREAKRLNPQVPDPHAFDDVKIP